MAISGATDAGGIFEAQVAPGDHLIRVQKSYAKGEAVATVPEGGTVEVPFMVTRSKLLLSVTRWRVWPWFGEGG